MKNTVSYFLPWYILQRVTCGFQEIRRSLNPSSGVIPSGHAAKPIQMYPNGLKLFLRFYFGATGTPVLDFW